MTREELSAVVQATGCAVKRGGFVFLCDPNWSSAEKNQAEEIMRVAEGGEQSTEDRGQRTEDGWLCIRTGGSSGGVKFARHDEQTLSAAVRGFCAHFGSKRVNAVDVLPPHHVSGFMARVRCAMTNGTHIAWDWKRLDRSTFRPSDLPDFRSTDAEGAWVISLVPTQLQRLLARPEAIDWLRGFEIIFLGGGPLWPDLADAAARAGLRISPSYGMTETAAMIAALRPEEFLAGARSCGPVMPHARARIEANGRIAITGESLFRGYVGAPSRSAEFLTEDLGRIDERGHLHVLGRADAVIITGGKKVQPAEVEAALRASGEFEDVAVIGVEDPEWGQAVVACYPEGKKKPDVARAVRELAPHQRPKRFVALKEWPRNAQGKIDRAALRKVLTTDGADGTDKGS